MKIRRFFGRDCNSHDGFNDGYYLDEILDVSSIDEAFNACREALADRYPLDPEMLTEMDNGFELVTGYYDDDGNDLSFEDFQELNENREVGSWTYVYVTFEPVNEGEI